MFRKKKSRLKLPLRAYLLYFTLLSFLLTGVTFSKYVTRSTGGDSARVVKFGNLQIRETVPANGWVIVPGVNITKDASVYVEPTEVDTYIFLVINVTGFTTTNYQSFSFMDGNVTWSVESGWTQLHADDNVYYLKLETNTELNKNIIANNTVTVSANITETMLANNTTNPTITFKAYMVQAGGFATAQDAWNSVYNP